MFRKYTSLKIQHSASRKLTLLTLMAYLLGACSLTANDADSTAQHHSFTPAPPFIASDLPQGDDSYSVGFRSGCTDGIGLAGFGALQLHDPHAAGIFRTSQDTGTGYFYDLERSMYDPDYNMGYKDGRAHCGYAANAAIGY